MRRRHRTSSSWSWQRTASNRGTLLFPPAHPYERVWFAPCAHRVDSSNPRARLEPILCDVQHSRRRPPLARRVLHHLQQVVLDGTDRYASYSRRCCQSWCLDTCSWNPELQSMGAIPLQHREHSLQWFGLLWLQHFLSMEQPRSYGQPIESQDCQAVAMCFHWQLFQTALSQPKRPPPYDESLELRAEYRAVRPHLEHSIPWLHRVEWPTPRPCWRHRCRSSACLPLLETTSG